MKKVTVKIRLIIFVSGWCLMLLLGVLVHNLFETYNRKMFDPMQAQIAEKVLRFHVLANSNSTEDQEVKKKVRDAVGLMMKPKLKEADTMEQTRRIVKESMDEIVAVAEETVRKNGYHYQVSAGLEHTEFPVKTYGNYTFPAGEYEALRIVLGEGKGHNWWCVLYPNMCFQGSVYEVLDDTASKALQKVLSPEEYEDVFTHGNYTVHWKILEYFN